MALRFICQAQGQWTRKMGSFFPPALILIPCGTFEAVDEIHHCFSCCGQVRRDVKTDGSADALSFSMRQFPETMTKEGLQSKS